MPLHDKLNRRWRRMSRSHSKGISSNFRISASAASSLLAIPFERANATAQQKSLDTRHYTPFASKSKASQRTYSIQFNYIWQVFARLHSGDAHMRATVPTLEEPVSSSVLRSHGRAEVAYGWNPCANKWLLWSSAQSWRWERAHVCESRARQRLSSVKILCPAGRHYSAIRQQIRRRRTKCRLESNSEQETDRNKRKHLCARHIHETLLKSGEEKRSNRKRENSDWRWCATETGPSLRTEWRDHVLARCNSFIVFEHIFSIHIHKNIRNSVDSVLIIRLCCVEYNTITVLPMAQLIAGNSVRENRSVCLPKLRTKICIWK